MVRACFVLCACLVAAFLQVSATPVPQESGIFGNKFQGDIELTELQKKVFLEGEKIDPSTGWTHPTFRWPTNLQGHVVVPYRVEAHHGFTTAEMNFLLDGMRIIEAQTCIRFVVHTNQIDFLDIINGGGCWSWLGRIGGRQELSMQRPGCFWGGTAEHEYIHALGYDHMHNAQERDQFVQIFWQHISGGTESNFNIVDPQWFSNFGTPYDLRSVMHYPRWAFQTGANLDTVVPHDRSYLDIIGMGRFSGGDATRLNRMYECMTH